MALEIERKFLVRKELLPSGMDGVLIKQGYLFISDRKSVRVRISGHRAFITVKGRDNAGVRDEFEYEIPSDDAAQLLENYAEGEVITKIRYHIVYRKKLWEVDEFRGSNEGLWMAEIELDDIDEKFELPGWAGPEVTGDPRYFNSYLATCPYSSWMQS